MVPDKLKPANQGKVLVISSGTFEKLLRSHNEWDSFEVRLADISEPKLYRAEAKTVLELPRAIGGIFNHPFKIEKGESGYAVSEGRVQSPNNLPPVLVNAFDLGEGTNRFVWVRVWFEPPEFEESESPTPYLAAIESGASFPTGAGVHKLIYTVSSGMMTGEGAAVELTAVTAPVYFFILGRIESDGTVSQWLNSDILCPWSPVTIVRGGISTLLPP